MWVTFLDHSGFLVETGTAALLFDWWKGTLPDLAPGVPLYVFASHAHPDHFDPRIFALDDGSRDIRFLLGHDIKLSERNCRRWGLSKETAVRCQSLKGGQILPLPDVTVEALPSTDEGAAFLVTLGDRTLYHAGDLNWWHWEGEDKAWNRNQEVNFQRWTEPLRGRRLDLAMLPLDPRLGEAGFLGPAHLLEKAEVRHFLPMHQWGDFGFTEAFLQRHGAFRSITIPVERPGQTFELE